MHQPQTSYARNGEVSIAYQVVGEGPLDLVFVPGYISHLDLIWSVPQSAAFLRRLASFSRLILFDKRGTGLSDPVPGVPTLEERMGDLHAVLDAVGSRRAALLGWSEGGAMSILFAATYPSRTVAMILFGATPKYGWDERFPPEVKDRIERVESKIDEIVPGSWGEGRTIEVFAPSFADDAAIRRSFGLLERASASPAMAQAMIEATFTTDVTSVLPSVAVPTLVLHHSDDPAIPVEAAHYMAERIPGARCVEVPGEDHIPFLGDVDAVLDEAEHFLTGARQSRDPGRALATILFTDIVGSTERASELGDRHWRELLEAHDVGVRRQVETHGGRVVKGLGDGFLATFDGPARAIRCADAVGEDARELGIEVRAGIHTGECELLDGDVGGMAVHIGARVAAKAAPAEVLVSSVVRDLVVGSGIEFEDRGTHELKGVPGSWDLLAVANGADGRSRSTASGNSPDRLAPNREVAKRGDRAFLRLARSAPSVPRLISGINMRRAKRRAGVGRRK